MSAFAAAGDVPLRQRPLIVTDVDEVVLEFLTPFMAFLEAREHALLPRSFRLDGNTIDRRSGEAVSEAAAKALLESFYTVQDEWQTPAARAVEHVVT